MTPAANEHAPTSVRSWLRAYATRPAWGLVARVAWAAWAALAAVLRAPWWATVGPAFAVEGMLIATAWRTEARRLEAERVRRMRTPRFSLRPDGRVEPSIDAAAGIVSSPDDGRVVWQLRADEVRPIASVTKLMTALVVFDIAANLDHEIAIVRADLRSAPGSVLRRGDLLSVRHLLHLMLVASDNGAARALARSCESEAQSFVALMNAKAAAAGLDRTRFADPCGLDRRNVSSAGDVGRMVALAGREPFVSAATLRLDYDCLVGSRRLVVRNTNSLVKTREAGLVAGKTGHTPEAGYCLATLFAPAGRSPLAVVVLGAPSEGARSWETRHLVAWAAGEAGRGAAGLSHR